MPCYKPLTGWRARKVLESGRRPVVFRREDGFSDLPVPLPCGQCIGCRLERSRQWATRCMHEASLHVENCSLTLTYDDAHLVETRSGPTLVPRHTQLFMKRLRRWLVKERGRDARVSFFLCGEYGGMFGRPHYHVLLFGVWFGDSVAFKKSRAGFQLYRSNALESLWPFGNSDVGSLTFESAAYAARYVVEKINGDAAPAHYGERVPEFVRMSLRPAIGKRWFERFSDDVYPDDTVIVRGREARPPVYYDKLCAESSSSVLEEAKKARAAKGVKSIRNRTPSRLAVREQVQRARLSLYKK